MALQRLILTYARDGIQLRALYRSADCPGPGTRARRREVTTLARTGLERALEALGAGDVEDLGTSGFTTREDVLGLPLASSTEMTTHRPVKPRTKGARA